MVDRVTLWDVGAGRQCELRGPDALRFADYLSPRRLDDLPVGGCRFTPVCDEDGQIMADCVDVWVYNTVELRGVSNRLSGYKFCPAGGGGEMRWLQLKA